MLGVPFREDPGVPALYGAHLLMTGAPAAVLQQGIGLFALAQIGALYALARSLWGGLAGVVAACLWAALPLGYTLLGWHGLANAAALALLALLLLYLADFARGRLDPAAAVGAGLLIVGLAAAHRLTFGIAMLTAGLAVAVALLVARDRRELVRPLAIAVGATVLIGVGVAYDLIERNSSFGGTQNSAAYLASKVDLELLVRDLTIPFTVAGVAAVVAALFVVRDRRTVLPLLCLAAVVAALAYSWLVDVPLHYTRMAYYLPLALVPLIAAVARNFPAPHARGRGGARAGGGHCGGCLEPGRRRPPLLPVRRRRLPARAWAPVEHAASGRGGGHGPLLELPGHLAAQHADASRRSIRRTSSPRRSSASPVRRAPCCAARPKDAR